MQRLHVLLIIIICIGVTSGTIAQNINARQFNVKGLQYLETGNYEKARECFMQAIQLDPTNKLYYNNCAVACINLKKYQESATMLSIALTIDPYYVKALANMAIVKFHLLRFADAYTYYKRALTVDSYYIKERFTLDKIIAGVKKVKNENPDNSDINEILRRLEMIKRNNQDIYLK